MTDTKRAEDTTAGAAGVTVIPSHAIVRHFAHLPPEALIPVEDHKDEPCGACHHLHDAEDRCVQGCGCPGWLPF